MTPISLDPYLLWRTKRQAKSSGCVDGNELCFFASLRQHSTRFLHALNYTMVLSGPEAQQLATYIGWLMHGGWGGIAAGVLFVLPSLFVLSGLTWVYLSYGDVSAIEGVLYGIKPVVTAIVVFAAYHIGSKALKNNVLRGMAVLAFIAIFAFNIPFPYID